MRALTRWGIGLALLAVLVGGCDPAPADPDAGLADGAAVDSGPRDAGPSSTVPLPAPPDFGTCPTGWRATEVDGAHLCDPWPVEGIAECSAPDEAHFPGGAGCERVGTACGDDGFAPDLPASGVIFVRAGATGGDGSRARPFGTIAAGLAASASGSTVALSADVFVQDQIDLPEGVTLHGACVSATVLRSDSDASGMFLGAVQVAMASGGLRNLRVEGERVGIMVNGGELDVRDVVVAQTVELGIKVVNDGVLTATRLVVRDTRPVPGALAEGGGLDVSNRGRATVTSAVFARNRTVAVDASGDGSTLELTDVAVHDTLRDARTDTLGVAIQGNARALVTATRVAVDRASFAGIRALDGARVEVHVAVVRDIEQSANITDFASGVSAERAATLTGDRVWIERASHAGATAFLPASVLVLRDAMVRDTRVALRPMPDIFGLGVWAQDGTELTLERAVIAGNTFAGVLVQESSRATLTDIVVRDTARRPVAGSYGRGLEVVLGGTVTLTRGLFERNHDATITAYGAGASIDARDVTVRDTRAIADGRFGYAAQIAGGATLTLSGADLETSRGHGVFAIGAGTRIVASGVRIADVRPFDCEATTCGGISLAYGAAAVEGASIQLSRFVFEGTAEAALQLASGGEADLSEGMIAESPIGFNVQTAGFDESRLYDRVTFRGVAVELDMSALAVGVEVPPFGI